MLDFIICLLKCTEVNLKKNTQRKLRYSISNSSFISTTLKINTLYKSRNYSLCIFSSC